MKKDKFFEVELWTIARTAKGNAVLLKVLKSDRAIPIYIGQLETQSILIGMGSIELPRPLTHDLYLNTLKKFNARVERVEITGFSKTIFYASLVLRRGARKFTLDSRPSDAFAIATRFGCPMFVTEDVISKASIPTSIVGNAKRVTENKTALADLKRSLNMEIKEENYEKAAKIRDQIRELESDLRSGSDSSDFTIEEGIFQLFGEDEGASE